LDKSFETEKEKRRLVAADYGEWVMHVQAQNAGIV